MAGLLILVVDDNRINRLMDQIPGGHGRRGRGGRQRRRGHRGGGPNQLRPGVHGHQHAGDGRHGSDAADQSPEIAGVGDTGDRADGRCDEPSAPGLSHAAGMDGVVAKPFTPAQLLGEIVKIAERSEEDFEAVG